MVCMAFERPSFSGYQSPLTVLSTNHDQQINIHHMHHPDSPNHHTPLNLSRTFSCQPLLVPLQSQMDYIPHHSSHKLQTGHEWDFVVQIQALRLHQHVANHSVSRQFSNFIRHFLVHCFHGTIQLRRKLILFFSPLRKTVTIFSFATDSFPSPASFSIHFLRLLFLLDRQETNRLYFALLLASI